MVVVLTWEGIQIFGTGFVGKVFEKPPQLDGALVLALRSVAVVGLERGHEGWKTAASGGVRR